MRLFSYLLTAALAVAITLFATGQLQIPQDLSSFTGSSEQGAIAEAGEPLAEDPASQTDDTTQSDLVDAPAEVSSTTQPAPIEVVVQRSQAEAVRSAVILRGRTEALRELRVLAETSGRVINTPLPRGTVVSEGDTMCILDPGTRQAQLQQANAALAEAEVNRDTARSLAERGFESETAVISATARLEAAQAAVEQAEQALSQLTITAPFSGVLDEDTAEIGTLLQPGAVCGTLLALDQMRLVGFVSERDVNQITVGAPAQGRLLDGTEVIGEVAFISRSADPLTRTYRVDVLIENPQMIIRDGATAEIRIARPNTMAHLAPQSVLTLDDQGRLGVRVNDDGIARFRVVEILQESPDGLWLAGLGEQAEIIVVGQDFVTDGTAISPNYRDAEDAL